MKHISFFILNHLKNVSLITLCFFYTLITNSQTTKINIKEQQFELPVDNNFDKKNDSEKTLKSFCNFGDILISRAILPSASFADGPTSGLYIDQGTINQQSVPFINKQPIQGFSAVLNNYDGTFMAMTDNGFGSIENSSDYNLRMYKIKPEFKSITGIGNGTIDVVDYIELRDPFNLIPFAITNHFTSDRILTGADFDIESMQRTANGDYWIGDEFGPFILHFDKTGVLLDPPFALPDYDNLGKELRSPQNPFNEESSAIRVMNAIRSHAKANGSLKNPVMSPWYVLLDDDDENTKASDRENPPIGFKKASSELFNVSSLNRSGHSVVVYTVNDLENMNRLLNLGVQGIISDRPDLLLEAIQNFDKNKDGKPDYIDSDGLIDINLFDAQGHRGARNLRPENTLPAMEAALDFLMPTLETDCGITLDGIPVLDHDPHIESAKVRKLDNSSYEYEDEVLLKNVTLSEIQNTFVADKILEGKPYQTNDLIHSPVSVAFAKKNNLVNPYVMPSLQQLFDFVEFYKNYYKNGVGYGHIEANKRWKNAEKVRFNVETKINPRTDKDERGVVFAERTTDPETFTKTVADVIVSNNLTERVDIQSFDFRTLLITHKQYPAIRTVCLFGDFPKVGNIGSGDNLQDQNGQNTPWLAGLYWPYRQTKLDNPFRIKTSGGFEGMAITTDNKKLLALLEKPIIDSDTSNLVIHEFDIKDKSFTGKKYLYPISEKATAISDFIMFSRKRGLIIERDNSQGDLNGFKAIYEIELNQNNEFIKKKHNVDLLKIKDIRKISEPGLDGDIGIGKDFAFPFVTIESIIVFNPFLIGVLNDNNYPFSIGRHVKSGLPDDNEFILIWLDQPLGNYWCPEYEKNALELKQEIVVFPNTFSNQVTFTQAKKNKLINNNTISIDIYSIKGDLVRKLVNKKVNKDNFSYIWDGKTDSGSQVTSGVYIAIIEINGTYIKKKILKK